MEARAKANHLRYGPIKLRQVANLFRGKSVDEAFAMLSLMRTTKKGAVILENVLKSAVANLQNSEAGAGVATSSLVVKSIQVDGGPIMKRIRPRSQGRAFRIHKQMSHITVVVAD